MFVTKLFIVVAVAVVMIEAKSAVGKAESQRPTTIKVPPIDGKSNGRKKRSTCSYSPSVTSTMTQTEINDTVSTHNDLRGEFAGASDTVAADEALMEWDTDLADRAAEWAVRCDFVHGFTDLCSAPIGQNLAITTASGKTPSYFIDLWFDEKDYYSYATRACETGQMCGHYTQVVWHNSLKVGCAMQYCDNNVTNAGSITSGTYFVCNYSPAGNYQGQYPYTNGTAPCTECGSLYSNNTYKCVNDLCAGCAMDDSSCGCIESMCADGETAVDSASCSCTCASGKCGTRCESQNSPQYASNCGYWQGLGFCSGTYKSFMKQNCRCSCPAE